MHRIPTLVLISSLVLAASACSDNAERPTADIGAADSASPLDMAADRAVDDSTDASIVADQGPDMAATDLAVPDAADMPPSPDLAAGDIGQGAGSKCAAWDVQTIFPIAGHVTTRTGGASALAFDSAGAAHVSFTTNLGLYYGTNAAGGWAFEQIPSPRPVTATGIAVDGQGRVDIVYYEGENFDVRQTTNATGAWVTTLIAGDGIVGEDLVMSKDSQGSLHIAYLDGTRSTLVYGVRQAGVWTLEDAQTGTRGRPVPALFMDGTTPLISFGNYAEGLKFATRATGSWVVEPVDDGFDIGGWSSVAKDEAGDIHISYHKHIVDAGELKYATNESGTWVSETVDSMNNTGWDTALQARGGVVHIAYVSSYPSGDLRYAARDANGWTTQSISETSSYSKTSMVFDPAGQLAVSFKRSTNALGLARCVP